MTSSMYKNHRKIWIEAFGEIPTDDTGKSYEIHHIDGNPENNCIDNLSCVSIQEHYDIHYSQKEYGACFMIGKRLDISAKEKSEIASLSNLERVKNGTHPFIGGDIGRKANQAQLDNGTHPFLQKELQDKIKNNRNKLIKENKHHLQSGDIQREMHAKHIKNGTHRLQKGIMCRKKNGETLLIDKDIYYKQKENNISQKLWEYVTINSHEGKARK